MAHNGDAALWSSRSFDGLARFSSLCIHVQESGYPVFSIDVRYQPGAAHQKGAASSTTAPSRTPEVAENGRASTFLTRHSIRAGFDHAIENRTPSQGGTQGATDMTTSFKHENIIKLAASWARSPNCASPPMATRSPR
ncbi:MAG TPA: hypothetical protein VFX76_22120 [Roseiflexaceae bacterium]|nr:hypothetical protein [Roseiflexaceae bacterium]